MFQLEHSRTMFQLEHNAGSRPPEASLPPSAPQQVYNPKSVPHAHLIRNARLEIPDLR